MNRFPLLCFSSLLFHALAGASENIQSRFDGDLDGWTVAPSSQVGTSLRHLSAGGDPGGFATVAAIVDTVGLVTTLADSGPGSLRTLVSNPAVTTIIFDPRLSGQTIVLGGSQILINRDVVIDASALAEGISISGNSNGDTVINAGESRIFEIASGSAVTLRGLHLKNGIGSFPGGGAVINYGQLVIEDCEFSGNYADWGGAIYSLPSFAGSPANMTIRRTRITGNDANAGGGIFNSRPLKIYDSTISENTAGAGAGLYSDNGATLYSTTLSDNYASREGGGIYNDYYLTLIQCTLSGNTSGTEGAGIYSWSRVDLYHTTISGNTAESEGGGLYNSGDWLRLIHSIVAGNTAPLHENVSGFATASNSNSVETLSLTSGDPLLAPLGDYGGPTETMPPLAGSPAIDGAAVLDTPPIVSLTLDGSIVPETPILVDQRGFLLGFHGAPDIGAVEFGPDPVQHRVDADATGANDGSTWADAFTELSAALAAAEPGDEIWVAAGVYTPGTNRADTFQLLNNVAIYGGFSGNETTRDQRNADPLSNATVLSGDIGVPGDITDNVYHVVNATGTDASALLSGFTITGGYADGPGTDMSARGAGLITTFAGGSPTLEDLRFVDNVAAFVGGAVYLNASSPTFTRIVFADNATTAEGDGSVNGFGGAIYANISSSTFIDCQFLGNHSPTSGGAVHLQLGSPSFTNTLFFDNSAGSNGGAVQVVNSSPTFINITVSANVAGNSGGGILHSGTGTSTLTNSIVWANTDASGSSTLDANLSAASPSLQHSLAQGRNPGGTNLDGTLPASAPAFFAPSLGDFRLGSASPARNAGDNAANPTPTDLAAQTRIQGSAIDLGALEGARSATVELVAPAKYLGDLSAFLDGDLNLSRRSFTDLGASTGSGGTILLTGAGMTLRYNLPRPTPGIWSRSTVVIAEDAGWEKVSGGLAPTATELADVLADVTSLRLLIPLRGGLETIGLDRVDLSPPLPADYFRFGDNPDAPSPGTHLQTLAGDPLTAVGVTAYLLPESGPGSGFPRPVVTQPGVLNTQAADFGLGTTHDAARILFVADSVAPTRETPSGSTVTVEAFIHATTFGDTDERIIAAHGSDDGAGSTQFGWSFGVDPAGALIFRANASGSPGADAVFTAPFILETGRDYFVAATFNEGALTFGLQDLTAGTELEVVAATQVANGIAAPNFLFDPVAPLTVGNLATGNRAWHGLIDEVRITTRPLAPTDWLTAPFDTSGGLLKYVYFNSGENLDLASLGGTAIFDQSFLSWHAHYFTEWEQNPHRLDYDPLSRVRFRLDMPGIVGSGVNDLIQYRPYSDVDVLQLYDVGYFMADIAPGPNFGPGTYRLLEPEPGSDVYAWSYGTQAYIGSVPDGYSYELVREDSFGPQDEDFRAIDMVVRPARTLTEPVMAASDADLGEIDLDLGFKGGSLHLTESFSSSERRLFIHEGHDAVIEVDAEKTVDWNGTTLNFGRFIKRGDGTLNFPDGLTHLGHFHFDGGLVTGSLNTLPNYALLFFNGGAYHFDKNSGFQNPIYFGPLGGTLDIASEVFVNTTYEGFTGPGPITKTGEGELRATLKNSPINPFIVEEGTLSLAMPDNRTVSSLTNKGHVKVVTAETSPRRFLTLTDTLALDGTFEFGNAHLDIQSGSNPPLIGSGTFEGDFNGSNFLFLNSSADFTFGQNFIGNYLTLRKYGEGTMAFDADISFPTYSSSSRRLSIYLHEGGLTIPSGFEPDWVTMYPGTELVIGNSEMSFFKAYGGTVRLGPGFLTVRFVDEVANDETRFVMKLSQPGVYGQGVNDMIVRNFWLDFNPVFDIEAHPGFGPGRYRLMDSIRGFYADNIDARSRPPTLGITPDDLNYSYHLEVVEGFVPAWSSPVGRHLDLIVTANPVPYADWAAEYDWDGHDSGPMADPLGRGLTNLLAYFHGVEALGTVPAERFTFQSKEVIDDQAYWVMRLRKNHHFDEETATWTVLSSDTLDAESWQTHAHEDILTEWVGLSEDGNATLYDLKIPAAESSRRFFRIAVDLTTGME